MTPYATPAELANYIDPDGVQFDPVTLTYSDGTTVTLAREAEIVTMGPNGPSEDEPAPPAAPKKKRGPKKSKRKAGEV